MKLSVLSVIFALTAVASTAHNANAAGKNVKCEAVYTQLSNGGESVATLDLYADADGTYSVEGSPNGPNLSKDPNVIELDGFNKDCNGAKVKVDLSTGEGTKEVQYFEHTFLFGERCTSSSKISFTGCKNI